MKEELSSKESLSKILGLFFCFQKKRDEAYAYAQERMKNDPSSHYNTNFSEGSFGRNAGRFPDSESKRIANNYPRFGEKSSHNSYSPNKMLVRIISLDPVVQPFPIKNVFCQVSLQDSTQQTKLCNLETNYQWNED